MAKIWKLDNGAIVIEPCKKFIYNRFTDQVDKVVEEYNEMLDVVSKADSYIDEDEKKEVIYELFDLAQASITALHIYAIRENLNPIKIVQEKRKINKKRGYYE